MRTRLYIYLLLAVGVTAVGVLSVWSRGAALVAAIDPEVPNPSPAPQDSSQLHPGLESTRLGESRVSAAVMLSDLAASLEADRVYEGEPQTLDEKYAGASQAQLSAALSLLKERRDAEMLRITNEIMQSGNFETTIVPVGTPAPEMSGQAATPGPRTFAVAWEPVGDQVLYKRAEISGAQYPDYRALELEVDWLMGKIHLLNKQAKNATSPGH